MKSIKQKTILVGTLVILFGTTVMSATAANTGVVNILPYKNSLSIQTVCSQIDETAGSSYGSSHNANSEPGFYIDYRITGRDAGGCYFSSIDKTNGKQLSDRFTFTQSSEQSAGQDYASSNSAFADGTAGNTVVYKVKSVQKIVRVKIEITYSLSVQTVGNYYSAAKINVNYVNDGNPSDNICFEKSIEASGSGSSGFGDTETYIVQVPSGSTSTLSVQSSGAVNVPEPHDIVSGNGNASANVNVKVTVL